MSEPMVTKAAAIEDVRIMADRLAMLYQSFVEHILAEKGEAETEKFVKAIITDYGFKSGQNTKKAVIAKGFEPTLLNFKEGGDLPKLGWEKAPPDEPIAPGDTCGKVTYCPFANYWKGTNFERWGRLYCFVDQAKYDGYGGFKCLHEKNTLDGDAYCIVHAINK